MSDESLLARIAALEAENARLRAEAAAGSGARDAALLMTTAQHRVRNMLAVIRAIVGRTATTGISIEEFAAHLRGRINTLLRLQGMLTRSDGIDLEEMVREELVGQGGLVAHRAEIAGPQVTLRGQAAEVLGLALHELAVNAVKFGALSAGEGRVMVQWTLDPAPDGAALSLRWTESGGALPQDGQDRGFGRALIEDGLPYQLSARTGFELRPDGLSCSIVLPVGP